MSVAMVARVMGVSSLAWGWRYGLVTVTLVMIGPGSTAVSASWPLLGMAAMVSTTSIPDVTSPMIWYVLADAERPLGAVSEDDEELGPDRSGALRPSHRDGRRGDRWP